MEEEEEEEETPLLWLVMPLLILLLQLTGVGDMEAHLTHVLVRLEMSRGNTVARSCGIQGIGVPG